jgi:choline kinase
MKVIIAAGGVGSRISGTTTKPKSTLEVEGKALIRRTVEHMCGRGWDVTVITGYKKQNIYDALKGLDVTYFNNPFYRVTNSIASLWFARDHLTDDDDYIIMNADLFYDYAIIDRLSEATSDITAVVDYSRADIGDYFFNVESGTIQSFGKQLARENRNCEYVGIIKIRKTAIRSFKEKMISIVDDGRYDTWWENAVYENLEEVPAHVMDVGTRFWAEVDTLEDYRRILEYVG